MTERVCHFSMTGCVDLTGHVKHVQSRTMVNVLSVVVIIGIRPSTSAQGSIGAKGAPKQDL